MALSTVIDLVDISSYLANPEVSEDCRRVAASLKDYGAVLIRDPRVESRDSDKFVDLMERYFAQPDDVKLEDARPHLFYQVRMNEPNPNPYNF